MSYNIDIPNTLYNILIVDDIPANLKVLGQILKIEGYKVRPVPNGELALQVAEKEKPDLILLDIMMPDMDGYEVCRRLKEKPNLKDIPVIFISALNDTEDIVKALNSGGVDYITKPFQAEEVKARVSTHIKLHQQNKDLQKLNADKDRFMSILAHDLKGPFNGIIGFTSLLAKHVRQYNIDKIEAHVNIINNSAQQYFKMLNDLLLWVRSQSGKIPYEPHFIEFNTICTEVIEFLKPNARYKNISINIQTSEIEVYADVDMLKTILRNLISNALKYTNKDGIVDIQTLSNEHGVNISVTDNGTGIHPEVLKKLFDSAQKISTAGTENESGTGLGLLLCKEFVEKHGGKIWVESEIDKGSTFFFILPSKIYN
jgi:two-component system sensor histidine kinase/response regulator